MPHSESEIESFLSRQREAAFCTITRHNSPHAVPIWFTYSDGKAYIHTDIDSVKVRNIQLNPAACLTVFQDDEAVILFGSAKIVPVEDFEIRTEEHIEKYHQTLDENGRDSDGIPLFDSSVRCVIEIVPDRILYW